MRTDKTERPLGMVHPMADDALDDHGDDFNFQARIVRERSLAGDFKSELECFTGNVRELAQPDPDRLNRTTVSLARFRFSDAQNALGDG